jgi:ABC-type long-subunit fatty acid transport system fused permease/ATPase subunit
METTLRKRPRPTREIVLFALRQPGGVVRWREVRDVYRKSSPAAREQERREASNRHRLYQHLRRGQGGLQYHMALSQVLRRHFVKVDGVNGFYVLRNSIVGED